MARDSEIVHLKPQILPPSTNILYRKRYLAQLAEAFGNGDEWVDVSSLTDLFSYHLTITNVLLKLGLIETRVREWNRVTSGTNSTNSMYQPVLQARITIDGRAALATGRVTYATLTKHFALPMEVWNRLEEMSQELGVENVTTLLRHIAARQEAFTRWFKNITAEDKK